MEPLREKVESKFPATFEEALRIAREKERKLSYHARREMEYRERVREEGMHEGKTVPTQQAGPPMGNTQEDNLSRITR